MAQTEENVVHHPFENYPNWPGNQLRFGEPIILFEHAWTLFGDPTYSIRFWQRTPVWLSVPITVVVAIRFSRALVPWSTVNGSLFLMSLQPRDTRDVGAYSGSGYDFVGMLLVETACLLSLTLPTSSLQLSQKNH